MPHPKVKIADNSGNEVSVTSNRLDVTTQEAAYGTFVTFEDISVGISANSLEDLIEEINDAKEILIQSDDANTGHIMVGSSELTKGVPGLGSRHGIKLLGGQTLILAVARFDSVWLEGSSGAQYVNVAYFK